jgi:hypothetical protein
MLCRYGNCINNATFTDSRCYRHSDSQEAKMKRESFEKFRRRVVVITACIVLPPIAVTVFAVLWRIAIQEVFGG